MNEKNFLGKKRNPKEIFKVKKTNETDSSNKKPKTSEKENENETKPELKETKNNIEEEFDYCLLDLIKKIITFCNNFSKLEDEDYTTILYNNFKELKNNDDFKSEIKRVLDNSNYSYFEKVLKFIIERKTILENSEKKGLSWYKDFVNERKKNPELYKKSEYYKENFMRFRVLRM